MNRRHLLAGAAVLPLAAIRPREGRAQSGISDGVVKIGVLDDMSGVFADQQGMGDVVAARMAAEDFGGKVGNMPIEVVFARRSAWLGLSSPLMTSAECRISDAPRRFG